MIEKAIQHVNKAYQENMIGKFAIGGAGGAIFYMESFETKDLDIFTYLPVTEAGHVSLNKHDLMQIRRRHKVVRK